MRETWQKSLPSKRIVRRIWKLHRTLGESTSISMEYSLRQPTRHPKIPRQEVCILYICPEEALSKIIQCQLKRKKTTAEFLSKHLVALENRLLHSMDQDVFLHVKQEINREFSDLLTPQENTILIHDVSDSLHKKIEATALNALNIQCKHLAKLADQLTVINHKIDSTRYFYCLILNLRPDKIRDCIITANQIKNN